MYSPLLLLGEYFHFCLVSIVVCGTLLVCFFKYYFTLIYLLFQGIVNFALRYPAQLDGEM